MSRLFDPITTPLAGVQLVEASAGTGKTFTLTTLLVRLLLERSLGIEQILVVTYTNAATEELRDRVRRRLRDALAIVRGEDDLADGPLAAWLRARSATRALDAVRLESAVRAMSDAPIFTIHAFCQRALAEHAFESGTRFGLELLADESELVAEIARDFWAKTTYPAPASQLRALGRGGLDLSVLRRIIEAAGRDPGLPLLPPAPPVDVAARAYEDALAHARRALALLRPDWFRPEAELRAALLRPGVLHKRSHAAPKVDDAMARVLAWLEAQPDPGDAGAPIAALDRLGPESVARATLKRQATPTHPILDEIGRFLAASREVGRAGDVLGLAVRHALCEFARKELPARKARAGQLAFDDLLRRLAAALDGEPHGPALARRLRERYPVALIDEFQDTDPVQYRVFSRVQGDGATLFLIGDPKQAIYGFRGADIHAYLAAADAAREGGGTLGTNYRSDASLVRAVNTVFSRRASPFLLDAIRFTPVAARDGATAALGFADAAGEAAYPPLRLRFMPRAGRLVRGKTMAKGRACPEIVDDVACEIARLLASRPQLEDHGRSRPLHAGDVAVLVATNKEGRLVQRALGRARIPSVLHGDGTVLDSEEAAEVLRVLRAGCDPEDATAVRSALATTLLGVGAHELLRLRDADGDGASEAWQAHVDRFVAFRDDWHSRGVLPALRALLRETDAAARLLGLEGGERRLTNVHHLGELLSHEAAASGMGPSLLTAWFERVHRDPRAYEGPWQDAASIRLERDDRAVQVLTVHRSKGLEYPVVFCPFAWSGERAFADKELLSFRDGDDAMRAKLLFLRGAAALDVDVARPKTFARREGLGERLRLLYVALTRARHLAVVHAGAIEGFATSGLAWLLHADPAAAHADSDVDAAIAAHGERLEDRSDEQLLADLAELAAASGGAIAVETLPAAVAPAPVVPLDDATHAALTARRATRVVADDFRTTSFSGLATSATHAHVRAPSPRAAQAEGLDRDGRDGLAGGDMTSDVAPGGGASGDGVGDPARDARGPLVPSLDALARGARGGQVLHDVLERADFAATAAALRPLAVERLAFHGFPEGRLEKTATDVAAALEAALALPLPALGGARSFALRDLPRARTRRELGFFLPVAGGLDGEGDAAALRPEQLAAIFSRLGGDDGLAYARRLLALRFVPVRGFLRGFIDLVFERDGRFYVVDYKSNHLGATPADYDAPRVRAAMYEGHYVLQYHLYTLALHRLLRAQLPGYDYDQDFGGVYYLFLRGMAARPGGDVNGVFADRPARALVDALDEAIGLPAARSACG